MWLPAGEAGSSTKWLVELSPQSTSHVFRTSSPGSVALRSGVRAAPSCVVQTVKPLSTIKVGGTSITVIEVKPSTTPPSLSLTWPWIVTTPSCRSAEPLMTNVAALWNPESKLPSSLKKRYFRLDASTDDGSDAPEMEIVAALPWLTVADATKVPNVGAPLSTTTLNAVFPDETIPTPVTDT